MEAKEKCDLCEGGARLCVDCRPELVECDKCERTLCVDCLCQMAVAHGMSEGDAGQVETAAGFLRHCEKLR